jgi:translation initiation factor 1
MFQLFCTSRGLRYLCVNLFLKEGQDMKNNDWKDRLGMVYSTNPDFSFHTAGAAAEEATLPNDRQSLRISLDRKHRRGKAVTLITGFRGKSDDLTALCKRLKVKCGTGGSAKDGEILIQGDVRRKVAGLLAEEGYGTIQTVG